MNNKIPDFDNHEYYKLFLERDLDDLLHYDWSNGYQFVLYQDRDCGVWIEIEKFAKAFCGYENRIKKQVTDGVCA